MYFCYNNYFILMFSLISSGFNSTVFFISVKQNGKYILEKLIIYNRCNSSVKFIIHFHINARGSVFDKNSIWELTHLLYFLCSCKNYILLTKKAFWDNYTWIIKKLIPKTIHIAGCSYMVEN